MRRNITDTPTPALVFGLVGSATRDGSSSRKGSARLPGGEVSSIPTDERPVCWTVDDVKRVYGRAGTAIAC
jgi:hypothetical protein